MKNTIPCSRNVSAAVRSAGPNTYRFIALSFIVLIFLAHSYYLGGYMADDSFISFRYARNLADGYGPVFNTGEKVEGYTSFGWMLIFALLHHIGVEPIAASRTLGLLSGAATLILCFKFMSRLRSGASIIISCLPPIFLALNGGFTLWSQAGMETSLFTFLISWAVFSTLRKELNSPFTGFLYALAALVRPEGLLFILLGLVYVFYRSRSLRETFIFAVPPLIILTPYHIWRISYYGMLFPNTFYAKTSSGFDLVPTGLDYLARGFSSFHVWIFLIPFLASFLEPGTRKISLFFLWLALPYCTYVTHVGGDWMPMFRFVIPLLPMFYVAAALGMANLLNMGAQARRTKYTYYFWAAFLIIAGCLTFEYSATKRAELIMRYHNLLGPKKVGLWLAENASPDTTIALGFVGAIPYYSRLETVDIWGITNRDIARQAFRARDILGPGHYKHDADSVLARNPDIIIFNSCLTALPDEAPVPRDPAERELFDHALFSSLYRPGRVRLGKNCYFRFYISEEGAGKVPGRAGVIPDVRPAGPADEGGGR